MTTETTASRGDATREALIRAAVEIFGRDGFNATGTRALAEAAGVNQALIAYHFGGKQGLYLATFEHIATQVLGRQRPAIEAIEAVLALPDDDADAAARRARYLPPLLRYVDGLAAMLTTPESTAWAQMILREQQSPTVAFAGFMGRVLELLARLLQRLHGVDADTRLLVLTCVGQALVFRAARAAVLRLMGWRDIGDAERAAIQQQIRDNLVAQLAPAP
jgi:TetR/AcrR family transcriptional regulator, regulator of cefoperazone and chloramphenicol sensitivity